MATEISNKNMLSPVGFTFTINRLTSMNFFVQSVTLPGITLGSMEQPTPFRALPIPGDRIQYSELDVAFKIDEDMTNYRAIFDWITALGFPDDFNQYKDLVDQPSFGGGGLYSDGNLMILSSAMNPNIRIDITDMFPISLTPIEMNTRDTSIEYLEATVSFRFTNYKFTRI
jgi:hypothetical protein